MKNETQIIAALTRKFNVDVDTAETAVSIAETESVAASARFLECSASSLRNLIKKINTVDVEPTDVEIVPETVPETVPATVETTETVEPETVDAETVETVPEITMLEKMKNDEIVPEINLSKLYKMKCCAELIFFNNHKKMFVPTADEIEKMKNDAIAALASKRAENPVCAVMNAPYEIPENPQLELQYDKKTNEPKSAFYIRNAVSFNCNIRYR